MNSKFNNNVKICVSSIASVWRFLKLKKLDWYIIRKFISTFVLSIVLLSIIIIVFDISEKIDDFIANDAPTSEIVIYYINFLPAFVNQFGSLFVFISVIFFTSKLASRSEIIAMLSNGVTFSRLIYPYILTATIITTLSIYSNEVVLPKINKHTREFEIIYWHGGKYQDQYLTHMQIEKDTYIYIQSYIDSKNTGYNFFLEKYDDGRMIYKLKAYTIEWIPDISTWRLQNVQERYFNGDGDIIKRSVDKDTILAFTPYDFKTNVDDVKTMEYRELRDFIDKERLKGSASIAGYEVEKIKRISFPVSAIILTLIGVSLSSRKTRGGTGIHLGLGILITFSYIMILQITSVFATIGGTISPFWACWIPNILFLALAIFLLSKAQK